MPPSMEWDTESSPWQGGLLPKPTKTPKRKVTPSSTPTRNSKRRATEFETLLDHQIQGRKVDRSLEGIYDLFEEENNLGTLPLPPNEEQTLKFAMITKEIESELRLANEALQEPVRGQSAMDSFEDRSTPKDIASSLQDICTDISKRTAAYQKIAAGVDTSRKENNEKDLAALRGELGKTQHIMADMRATRDRYRGERDDVRGKLDFANSHIRDERIRSSDVRVETQRERKKAKAEAEEVVNTLEIERDNLSVQLSELQLEHMSQTEEWAKKITDADKNTDTLKRQLRQADKKNKEVQTKLNEAAEQSRQSEETLESVRKALKDSQAANIAHQNELKILNTSLEDSKKSKAAETKTLEAERDQLQVCIKEKADHQKTLDKKALKESQAAKVAYQNELKILQTSLEDSKKSKAADTKTLEAERNRLQVCIKEKAELQKTLDIDKARHCADIRAVKSEREAVKQDLANAQSMIEKQKQAEVDEVRSRGQAQIDTLQGSLDGLQLRFDASSNAKNKSEEEILGLQEKFAVLRAELEEAKSILDTKGQAIDGLRKKQEKDRVVQCDMAELLKKLQADLDAANSSQIITQSELDTEKARLERVNEEKDDLEKALAVEQAQNRKAGSEIQELTVELALGSGEIRNLKSHAQLVEAVFRILERDADSILGFWLNCRIVRCLLQCPPHIATSVDEVLRRNGKEAERLLLGTAWKKIISQEGVDQSTQDQDHALFDVFSDSARQLPDQGHAFPSTVKGQEVDVCVNLLSHQEVVFVIKRADSTVALWHSHKSDCTMFTCMWKSWLRLDEGPQLDPTLLQVHRGSNGEAISWLKGVFDIKMPARGELDRCD